MMVSDGVDKVDFDCLEKSLNQFRKKVLAFPIAFVGIRVYVSWLATMGKNRLIHTFKILFGFSP